MSDLPANPADDAPPLAMTPVAPLIETLARDFGMKLVTTAASALATWGVVTKDQAAALIPLGVAALLWGLSAVYTYVAAKYRQHRRIADIAAPAAIPVVTGKSAPG